MKMAAISLALMVYSCATQSGAIQEDPEPNEFQINLPVQELVLDNGMRILIVEKPGAPRVHCALYWRVGSVNERTGITGLSHFFEHMMFKGTGRIGTQNPARDEEINQGVEKLMTEARDIKVRGLEALRRGIDNDPLDEERMKEIKAEYDKLIEEQKGITISEHLSKLYAKHGGTGLNASTSYDRTNYYVELPSNKVELFFWLEADRFSRPIFREFYPEREVVKEERRMRTESTPTGLIWEAYRASFWEAHPYHWPVIGWMSDIDQYRLKDAEAYFQKHYSPQNATAIFVGAIQADEVKALAFRYFGTLKRFDVDPDPIVTLEPAQRAAKRMEAEADSQPTFNCAWHGPSQVHADAGILDVLTNALSGRTGRLYRRLVDEKKIAVGAGAYFWGLRYGGWLNISANPRLEPDATRPEVDARLAEVEAAALQVIEEIKAEGLTERELEKVKNNILADSVREMQSIDGISGQLGYYDTIGTWKDMNTWVRNVQKVTNEDVIRIANQYFPVEGRNVLVVKRKEKKQ